jgi:hypothetical protein
MCAYIGWACSIEVHAPRWEVIHSVMEVFKFEIQTWFNAKSLCDDLLGFSIVLPCKAANCKHHDFKGRYDCKWSQSPQTRRVQGLKIWWLELVWLDVESWMKGYMLIPPWLHNCIYLVDSSVTGSSVWVIKLGWFQPVLDSSHSLERTVSFGSLKCLYYGRFFVYH